MYNDANIIRFHYECQYSVSINVFYFCALLLFMSECSLWLRLFFSFPLVQLKPFMKCVIQLDGWEKLHFEGDHVHGHMVVCVVIMMINH